MNNPKGNPTDLITDLETIDELLSRLKLDREIIVQNYPGWEQQRKATISENKKLLKKLNDAYKNCSIARGVGTGVGILGGLASITGVILSFSDSTRSLGKELTKYGSAVGGVGCGVSFSASAAEGWLSKGILDDVRAVSRKDLQLTQELFPCLQRAEKLDSVFKKVFDASVLSDSIQDFFTVVDEIEVISKEGANTYEDIANVLSSSIEGYSSGPILKSISIGINLEKLCEKVKLRLREFCENPEVRAAILKIYRSFKRSPVAFEFLKIGLMAARDMRRMLTNGIFLSLISTVSSTLAHTVSSLNMGLFQAVRIAIDIVAILSIADDIKNGKSKYSEMIEEVNELLSLELRDMKRAYLLIVSK